MRFHAAQRAGRGDVLVAVGIDGARAGLAKQLGLRLETLLPSLPGLLGTADTIAHNPDVPPPILPARAMPCAFGRIRTVPLEAD